MFGCMEQFGPSSDAFDKKKYCPFVVKTYRHPAINGFFSKIH